MKSIRKNTVNHFKGKVAIAAIKGYYTIAELYKQFGVASS